MRDKLTEIEANIRYMQGFLSDMLWHIQLLDAWYDELLTAETKARPLSHTQRDAGAIPASATK